MRTMARRAMIEAMQILPHELAEPQRWNVWKTVNGDEGWVLQCGALMSLWGA